jgi:hypothetical protein
VSHYTKSYQSADEEIRMKPGTDERRRHKRYSGVPLRLSLKSNNDFHFLELVDISVGGFLSNTTMSFEIYDEYEAKIEFPVKEGKDLIYAKAIVWRIEANKEEMINKRRYVAFQFTAITETDKHMIAEFLDNYQENVPYK